MLQRYLKRFPVTITTRENIKIETLDDFGEIYEIYIDINKSNSLEFSFDNLGCIAIRYNGDLRLTNITDIQSVTTFRETKLKFREVNKK